MLQGENCLRKNNVISFSTIVNELKQEQLIFFWQPVKNLVFHTRKYNKSTHRTGLPTKDENSKQGIKILFYGKRLIYQLDHQLKKVSGRLYSLILCG